MFVCELLIIVSFEDELVNDEIVNFYDSYLKVLFFHYFSLSLFPFLFPFHLFSNEEKKKEFFSIFISLLKEEKEEKLDGERERGRRGWKE